MFRPNLRPAILSLILLCAQTSAQQTLSPAGLTTAPLLVVGAAERPIERQRLRLNSEIRGGMAQTTVEMVFANPNNRDLEGELQFPLREGQQIVGFALDIDGKMRAAVPVEKARGQAIFEAVERQRVDPALLEATAGNNFKLRIYPIPAHGSRTVRLLINDSLHRSDKNWAMRLPFEHSERWKEVELDVRVEGASKAPLLQSAALSALRELRFAPSGNAYLAHARLSNASLGGNLQVLVPALLTPQVYTQTLGDERYFVAEVPVATSRTARVLPQRIGLLWDSSGSGAQRDTIAELRELDAYFKAVRNADVKLSWLRERSSDGGVFRVVDGNWTSLRDALQGAVYDGASNLSSWQPDASRDEYLLVSDGLQNYGNVAFPKLLPNQRLYALCSTSEADYHALGSWANASGGALVTIDPLKPGAAAQALTTEAARIDQFDSEGVSDLQMVNRQAEHGLLRLAGKLLGSSASLRLTLSENGQRRQATLRIDDTAADHPFAAQIWAGMKLSELSANEDLHRAEIRRVGQQFSLTTRETSLLVLDRPEDYLRYDVAPPAELADVVAFLAKAAAGVKRQATQKHLDTVVSQFTQRIEWWSKDFPKTTPLLSKPADAPAAGRMLVVTSSATNARPAQLELPPPYAPAPALAFAQPPAPAAMRADLEGARKNASVAGAATVGIALKKWRSDAPYIARLRSASAADLYAIYLDEKPSYANSSAFYLDVADVLIDKGQLDLGLRVLSNLAELDLENRALLRILGYRLLQAGRPGDAIPVFAKVVRLAPNEPQSFRDLGLAYAADGQFQAAIEQLNEVVERVWDRRFPEIEGIVLNEMNAIIATSGAQLDLSRIDPRLVRNLPLDLRVVLTWDADNTDIDLWVTDPNGEKTYFGAPLSYQGGRMSRDFTGGYGPEEYCLKSAKPGTYKIETNFYGNRQQVLAGATTVQVRLTSGFGTPKQKDQTITLRLAEARDTVFVGEFKVEP